MEHAGMSESLRETLARFEEVGERGEPLTTSEVTERLDVSRRSVYDRLERLVDSGHLRTKKVDSRGRVWWRPDEARADEPLGAETERKERACELAHQRTELEARERALSSAYEVITDPDRSFSEQVDDLLAVVREATGTDYATLSRVRGDEHVFESVFAPEGADLQVGDTVDLSWTNCERVVECERTLVLNDVESDAPELADRPSNADWGISCYSRYLSS
jgi:DNA-binding Lrp family transcriptional regulator